MTISGTVILTNTRAIVASILTLIATVTLAQQAFNYDTFVLNTKVSFNDVVNYVEDKRLMITEPSVYTTGEEIKYRKPSGAVVSLTFFEGTQILRGIELDNVYDAKLIDDLRQRCLSYHGSPVGGFQTIRSCDDALGHYDLLEFSFTFKREGATYVIAKGSSGGGTLRDGVYHSEYHFWIALCDVPADGKLISDKIYDDPKILCPIKTKRIYP